MVKISGNSDSSSLIHEFYIFRISAAAENEKFKLIRLTITTSSHSPRSEGFLVTNLQVIIIMILSLFSMNIIVIAPQTTPPHCANK